MSQAVSRGVEVLIVDEGAGLPATLRAGLEHAPALRTIDEDDLVGGGGEPVVALLGLDGVQPEAARTRIAALREGRSWLRVLVVFRALRAEAMQGLIEAGADAFVGVGASADEVCASALALADVVPQALASEPATDTAGLTPREAEVLRFLSAGFSNKEVARRLSLSVRTVETHRLNLRRKTQTGRLKDLVSLARQLRLDPVLDTEAPRMPARHAALAARA